MASKTDTSTKGRSDPAAARLREVAAKVRQVSTSPPNDVIVFGRLIKEAHDAGAWPEGSVIGDRLRRALTAPGSNNLRLYADETVPAWVLQANEAVLGELLSGLMLPSAPEEVGKWEAEILAAEIEREADRIEAESPSQLSGGKAANGRGQGDTRNDTREKKRLRMTKEATACAKLYRRKKQSDPDTAMKAVISEYVEENSGSALYIMRVLNDNPDQWKESAEKATKKR